MNTPARFFSFPQRWNAQDLADAVPRRLRLSRMIDFDALRDGADASANTPAPAARAPRRGYLRNPGLSTLFRVH